VDPPNGERDEAPLVEGAGVTARADQYQEIVMQADPSTKDAGDAGTREFPRYHTLATGATAGDAGDHVARQARTVAEQQKDAGAEQLGGMARAIHGAARELEDQMPQAAQFVQDAATKLEGAADALRERSVDDLLATFGRFARTQPLAFFGGAVLAGFAVSRFLKSSGQTAGGQRAREREA
jgi:hypothetical protein